MIPTLLNARTTHSVAATLQQLPYAAKRLLSTSTSTSQQVLDLILQRVYFDRGEATFMEFNADLGVWTRIDDVSAAYIITTVLGTPTVAGRWRSRLSHGPGDRIMTDRLRNGVLYFPMSDKTSYVVKIKEDNVNFTVKNVPTSTLADDIRSCYFHESHLMDVRISKEYVNLLNRRIRTKKFTELREKDARWDMFTMLCPKLSEFVFSSVSHGAYRTDTVINMVSRNILDLMVLLTVKSFGQLYNEKYTLQKIICLIGGGGTGKSQLVNLFTLLSLNNSQSCEMRHLHGRFESFAWLNRSLITFPDISRRDLDGNRWLDGLAVLKKLSGQDWIRGEGKYLANLTFRYSGLVMLVGNHPIPIDNTDFVSQYRRYYPIHFDAWVKTTVSDLTQNVLGEEILGVLALAVCLLEDGLVPQVVKDIEHFSLNEEVIVNKEHRAAVEQNDPLQAFIYGNFRKASNDGFPMFVHQLLVLLIRYLRERTGSRMLVRDIKKLEEGLRAPFVTLDLNCWKRLGQLVNRSKPELDKVPGLYDLLTTIVKPTTSALDYDPLWTFLDAVNDRLTVKRHPSLHLPMKLKGIKINQMSIEISQEDGSVKKYLMDTLVLLDLEPIDENVRNMVSLSPSVLRLPKLHRDDGEEVPIQAKAYKSKDVLMLEESNGDPIASSSKRAISNTKVDDLRDLIDADSEVLALLRRVKKFGNLKECMLQADQSDDLRVAEGPMSSEELNLFVRLVRSSLVTDTIKVVINRVAARHRGRIKAMEKLGVKG